MPTTAVRRYGTHRPRNVSALPGARKSNGAAATRPDVILRTKLKEVERGAKSAGARRVTVVCAISMSMRS